MDGNMSICMQCRAYSLRDVCPECGSKTMSPHPPRFSPEDRYGHYRRRLKEMVREESE